MRPAGRARTGSGLAAGGVLAVFCVASAVVLLASGLLGPAGLATRGWAWGSLAPALAAALVLALTHTRVIAPGTVVLALGARVGGLTGLGHVVRRVVLALGLGLTVVLLTMQGYTTVGLALPLVNVDLLPVPIGVLALGWLLTCLVEEFGWRGVLQPTLAAAWGWRAGALVTGLVWAGSQWSLLAQTPPDAVRGTVFVLALGLTCVAQSWLLAVMLRRMVRGQWAAAVALRWMTGMGLLLVGNEETGSWQGMALVASASVITAGFCLWLDGRRQLWRTGRG